MLRAFFGRHKSASTWARNILHEAAAALKLDILTIHAPQQWADYASVGDMIRDKQPDIFVMTNARQADLETMPELRALNIIRDPRDIIVSGYFSHRNSHPEELSGVPWTELQEHRKHLLKLDKEEGLLAEIEFARLFLKPMGEWNYHNPGVLELRMEDLITDSARLWRVALAHLQLLPEEESRNDQLHLAAVKWNLASRRETPKLMAQMRRVLPPVPMQRLPYSYVDNALQRFSFTRLSKTGRKPGEEDVNSHYRKGVSGDWKNHLTEKHLEHFRNIHGDLVERLGYQW